MLLCVSDFLALQELKAAELNAHFPLFARKTADETVNNSATLQNDNHLFLSVAASTTYELTGLLVYTSGATPDFKFGWTFPSGLTMRYTVLATVGGTFGTYGQVQTAVPAIDGAGSELTVPIMGIVIVSSTAGTLQLQWAQNTANASDTKLHTNSYISLMPVA